MKFTVDTTEKTITYYGSIKFEDVGNLRATLPRDWWGYTLVIEPNLSYTFPGNQWPVNTEPLPLFPTYPPTITYTSNGTPPPVQNN